MEGALQRWFREMVLVCAAGEKQRWILEHKTFSKTGIISHKTYNKPHKTKQRDSPHQDKKKKRAVKAGIDNGVWQGEMWTSMCLLTGTRQPSTGC